MGSVTTFLNSFDLTALISILISVVTALICITWHEISHGLMALKLGDPTAKSMGRLSLNPIRHIDPVGLLMMVIARVGWAKPVPIDARYFKKPKRDIALVSLAGPLSNLILALIAMGISSLVFFFWYYRMPSAVSAYVLIFFIRIAVLSTGLCIFNLIPISPLDGSKILFSLLPNRIYGKILHYERYGMILMVLVVASGVLDRPISVCINWVLWVLCQVTRFPFDFLTMLM